MKGNSVIAAVQKKFKASTKKEIANRLGLSVMAIHNWRKRKNINETAIARLILSAYRAGASTSQRTALRPLVEFARIERSESKLGASFELFNTKMADGRIHSYLDGLRKELEKHHGVYIFFDSRGQAIYTGKARKQTLWREMKLAFNRERGDLQKIKRVKHPAGNVRYRTSEEKSRQIRDVEIPLHDIATYFSAYFVTDGMINEVEAMLVRSFANDLLNKRMERFGQQKKKKKTK